MYEIDLNQLYSKLRAHFGFLNWWPGDTKLEVVIGAILTQQTSWKNVEKAIHNLKKARMLNLSRLARADTSKIEQLIRPSGFYKQKAERLKGVLSYIFNEYGRLDRFFDKNLENLRGELLKLGGIGNETADSIILYAAEKPIFVIDAYTKRIMNRLYGVDAKTSYEDLQKYFMKNIPKDVGMYKDFHAQFVEHAKNYCKKEPCCDACPINTNCKYYSSKRSPHFNEPTG